jgi:hypothetical protein
MDTATARETIGDAPRRREDLRFLTGRGQYLDELFGDNVGEIVLRRVAAQVHEGQDDDREPRRRRSVRWPEDGPEPGCKEERRSEPSERRRNPAQVPPPLRSWRCQGQLDPSQRRHRVGVKRVDMDGAGDIFDRLLSLPSEPLGQARQGRRSRSPALSNALSVNFMESDIGGVWKIEQVERRQQVIGQAMSDVKERGSRPNRTSAFNFEVTARRSKLFFHGGLIAGSTVPVCVVRPVCQRNPYPCPSRIRAPRRPYRTDSDSSLTTSGWEGPCRYSNQGLFSPAEGTSPYPLKYLTFCRSTGTLSVSAGSRSLGNL